MESENSMNESNIACIESNENPSQIQSKKRKSGPIEKTQGGTEEDAIHEPKRRKDSKMRTQNARLPRNFTLLIKKNLNAQKTDDDSSSNEATDTSIAPRFMIAPKTSITEPLQKKGTQNKTVEQCRNIILSVLMEKQKGMEETVSYFKIKMLAKLSHDVNNRDIANFKSAFRALIDEDIIKQMSGNLSGLVGSFSMTKSPTKSVIKKGDKK